jgi:dTDP-4-amino-4,6-dideoxygalactose transaminase
VARLLFSVPYVTGSESTYVAQAMASDHWQGDGPFTKRASRSCSSSPMPEVSS